MIRIDLTKYLVKREREEEWYAGEQLDALRFYLSPEVSVYYKLRVGDYSGNCYAILGVENRIVLWRDEFGSCSGCDNLYGKHGKDGYEYIKDTLQEGNTKQFTKIEDAIDYLTNDAGYFWEDGKENLIQQLRVLQGDSSDRSKGIQ